LYAGSDGSYTLSGGALDVAGLVVGEGGSGSLAVANAQAEIVVRAELRFGEKSTFSAAAGSTIRMAGGAAFGNASPDGGALAGLNDLTLIFEDATPGGPDHGARFEVAGRDIGPVPEAWAGNFALDALRIGGEHPGWVRLVDIVGGQGHWSAEGALYVKTFELEPGSRIDLSDAALYYLNGGPPKKLFYGDASLDGDVDYLDYVTMKRNTPTATGAAWADGDHDGDGDVDHRDFVALRDNFGSATITASQPVPEPATVFILALAAAATIRRRRARGHT
jgi:hypothetical protein